MKTIYQAISIVLVALFASCNSDETNAPGNAGGMTPCPIPGRSRHRRQDPRQHRRGRRPVHRNVGRGGCHGVLYSVPGSSAFSEPGRFVYNDNAFAFEGELPTATGEWQYMAFYPHAAVSGNTASIPFGNLRSQKGSEFNCASDALVAEMLGFSNAKQGETDEGEPVKFRLNRLTSILNLSVQGGAGAGDAVRHILLTSENDGSRSRPKASTSTFRRWERTSPSTPGHGRTSSLWASTPERLPQPTRSKLISTSCPATTTASRSTSSPKRNKSAR